MESTPFPKVIAVDAFVIGNGSSLQWWARLCFRCGRVPVWRLTCQRAKAEIRCLGCVEFAGGVKQIEENKKEPTVMVRGGIRGKVTKKGKESKNW
jgi:hypothetical protein